MKKTLFYFLALCMISIHGYSQKSNWQKISSNELDRTISLNALNKDHFETYQLNLENLKIDLSTVALRGNNINNSVVISFPNENGTLEEFKIYEAPLLSPELASIYPNIKTYVGFSTDNSGSRIRFSVTPQGVQSMVSRVGKPNTYLVPLSKNGNNQYIAYNERSRANYVKQFSCSTVDEVVKNIESEESFQRDADDQILRTFRIAISTTGEYTNFWNDGNNANGNAQADALAQVVATLNRVNEVFEVDMAVTFQLVSGTNIIYPTAASDPYTGNLNSQLQTTLTAQVGEANYDIGHLFTYAANNGNAGCIGCVCVNGQKGSGFSAHTFLDNDGGPYMTDFFDIDYVPHEIGHQMGANHTFATNNEGAGVNSEPGSGTSVMGYAGITGGNDVQNHSDPYFHYHSINQILNNLVTRTCWVGTPISNAAPVAEAGINYNIPRGTAFILKGAATDANPNDVLTYCWEQINSGVTTNTTFGPNHTAGPTWRSRPPSTSPNRYMPILSRVLAGQLTQTNPTITANNSSWETVSNVARTLNFGLTVRDRSETGGTGQSPQSSFDTMTVTVNGTAGPFTVTSQNSNVIWNVGTTQTITWNVAGTDLAPVSTQTVNILLSIDGGQTFPFTLASNISNDGSELITVPAVGSTSQARLIVEGNNNIFYAVNSSNFTIQSSEFVLNVPNPSATICTPNDATYNFTYNTFLGFNGTTTFSANGLPSGTSISFNPATAIADGTAIVATVSNTSSLAPGTYTFDLVGTSGTIVKTATVTLAVYSNTLNAAVLATPTDGATNVSANITLNWNSNVNAQNYLVEIATDASFTTITNTGYIATNSYTVSLGANTQYYWRVTASNLCATATTSAVFSFTTENVTCGTFTAIGLPIAISATGVNTYTSTINVPANLTVTDVNVTIDITHAWNADLDITLTSPAGTVIELSTDNGGNGDNYTNTIFNQQATTLITAGTSPFTGSFIPEGNLNNLNGQLSGGNWILSVTDDANQDGGSLNAFSLNICVQGSLSNQEVLISDFSIFPNPNNGAFTIKMNSETDENIVVNVFDIRGRSIFQKQYQPTSTFEQNINLDNIESGIYLVNVTSGDKQTTKKIIIK